MKNILNYLNLTGKRVVYLYECFDNRWQWVTSFGRISDYIWTDQCSLELPFYIMINTTSGTELPSLHNRVTYTSLLPWVHLPRMQETSCYLKLICDHTDSPIVCVGFLLKYTEIKETVVSKRYTIMINTVR